MPEVLVLMFGASEREVGVGQITRELSPRYFTAQRSWPAGLRHSDVQRSGVPSARLPGL